MINYLIPRLENLIDALTSDLRLIAKKKKDDEWKRDHYQIYFHSSCSKNLFIIKYFANRNTTGKSSKIYQRRINYFQEYYR